MDAALKRRMLSARLRLLVVVNAFEVLLRMRLHAMVGFLESRCWGAGVHMDRHSDYCRHALSLPDTLPACFALSFPQKYESPAAKKP